MLGLITVVAGTLQMEVMILMLLLLLVYYCDDIIVKIYKINLNNCEIMRVFVWVHYAVEVQQTNNV